MDERTTLLVLYAGSPAAAALGTAGQPKERLVGDILYGAAEAEGIAIVLSVIEVELSIEGSRSFQKIGYPLIVGTYGLLLRVGEQTHDFLLGRGNAARSTDVASESISTLPRDRTLPAQQLQHHRPLL